MDAVLKQKWIDALRSGTYKQITGVLHKQGVGHCVFGVLCEVSGAPSRVQGSWFHENSEVPAVYYTLHEKEWCRNLPYGAFGLPEYFVKNVLSMNDTQNKSFNQIADWIEANL